MRTIYLDYNSSTPLAGAARQAMLPFLEDFFAAAGNAHWQSRAVAETIEDTRSAVATMLGCNTSEIVFTSGGAESTNLALLGAARSLEAPRARKLKGHLIISTLEHLPVLHVVAELERQGWEVTRLACDQNGIVDAERLVDAIKKNTALISIQLGNAQLGSMQDIAMLSRLKRPANCLFHTDATQALGKVEVDIAELGVDLLSISAHKMYGPKGVGALFIRDGVSIRPQMFGGWEEGGMRPGTSSPMLLAGFGAAAQLARAGGAESAERLRELRDRFVTCYQEASDGAAIIVGSFGIHDVLPNTVCIQLPNADAATIMENLAELHVGIPLGNAMVSTASYEQSPFHAIGMSMENARSLVTISVGWNTTMEEVETAAEKLAEAHRD